MEMNISSIRKEYKLHSLNEKDVNLNPITQLKLWLDEAVKSELTEPTAMALATSTPTGRPSIRIVLLKEIEDKGLVFFTNYGSYKARQIESNPFAAVVFFWPELERQVRIEGYVEKVSEEISDKYFEERPEGSKIGAWASEQSKVIDSRIQLEIKTAEYYSNLSSI
ncbi:MAG: pyridoxamine 5'-phosphate oxidase [Ignavibacteria bacterium]|nr:pyridoxamine 5'-phosphate oxidase [Ignavibacteria bacterium]